MSPVPHLFLTVHGASRAGNGAHKAYEGLAKLSWRYSVSRWCIGMS